MKKRLLSLPFALTLIFTLLLTLASPLTPAAQAAATIASGACGPTLTWTLDSDGLLTISGTGEMEDYYALMNYNGKTSYAPWFKYASSIKTVSIDDDVTYIGWSAFYQCSALTSVTIPEEQTDIGWYTFNGCSSLTEIILPDGVTSIDRGAFSGCSGLTSITLPDGITDIGGGAFSGCSGLTNVLFPPSLTIVEDGAFSSCSELKRVIFRGSQEINFLEMYYESSSGDLVGSFVFSGCDKLSSFEFLSDAPSSLSLLLPDGKYNLLTRAGKFVIYYHRGTSGWTSPLWKGYYTACIDGINDYTTLNSNNRNAQGLFFTLNETAKTARVGDGTEAENNGGYLGAGMGQVVIPDTVSKDGVIYRVNRIGQYAFAGNRILQEIQLGVNVEVIDRGAFLACPNFTGFTVADGSPYYYAENGVLYDSTKMQLLFYPCGKEETSYSVPDNVRLLGVGAFAGCQYLRQLWVPGSVISIGSKAFSGCEALSFIQLPFVGRSANQESSLDYVFGSRPAALKTIVITGGRLKEASFMDWEQVENIVLPTAMVAAGSIPNGCFSGCSSLKNLVFTDDFSVLPPGTGGALSVPAGITNIGREAFRACLGLTTVSMPGSVISIGQEAFRDCQGLTMVSLPDSVTCIEQEAFACCDGLREFAVSPGNPAYCVDQWGVLFNKDKSVLLQYPASRAWPYYNVPDTVVTLLPAAFHGCAGLINLYIPTSVSALYGGCISQCPNTTVCVYLDSAADIYAGENSLNYWYMDNYRRQGIEIYSLPESSRFDLGQVDFSGLYVTERGSGKTLQLDDYQLDYQAASGLQQVTVSADGFRASFPILLYDQAAETLLDFGAEPVAANATVLVAIYDGQGRMTGVYSALLSPDGAFVILPNGETVNMDHAKIFQLDPDSCAPLDQARGTR